jgi:uncharacterized damage-inducible protein DinB
MKHFAVIVVAMAAVGCAQPAPPAEPAVPTTAHTDSIKVVYDIAKSDLTRAAEQMPEEDYGFKPAGVIDEVRSFGQIMAHVAGANGMFCGMVSGEAAPAVDEAMTAKADIVKALNDSFAFCDRAIASVNDQTGAEKVTIGFLNADLTKLGVLAFSAAHDMEHYGNIVTYMRAKGMVPPSSQPSGGGN